MTNSKFEFTGETKVVLGVTLRHNAFLTDERGVRVRYSAASQTVRDRGAAAALKARGV